MSKAAIIGILEDEFKAAFFKRASEQQQPLGSSSSSNNSVLTEADITEMPPPLFRLASESRVLVHAIDGLVPLRAIDPRKQRVNDETGETYMMQGHHLVRAFKQRIERAQRRYGGTLETVLSFDKSLQVPITKGPEQEKRRQASSNSTASEAAREAASTPLLEIPAEEAYITTETQLGNLGIWSEVMEDRLPAEGEEETNAYKVLEDGQRFALHQGRRQAVISFLCFALLSRLGDTKFCESGGGQSHDLTLTLGVNERVYLDGHCLRPDYFRVDMENPASGWIEGFFPPAPALLEDESIDWNTIPLVAWRQPGHDAPLALRFVVERRNTIGEGDFTMFAYAATAATAASSGWCGGRDGGSGDGGAVVFDTVDTDATLLAMRFQQKHSAMHCFVRITQRVSPTQRLTAALRDEPLSELRAWPKYVDVRLLLQSLERKFAPSFSDPLASFLAAMLTRGSDFTPVFAHVTHQRFWEALCQKASFIGHELTRREDDKLVIDAVCWLRLVLAAYSFAHDARLMRKGKLLYTNIDDARRVLNGEQVATSVVVSDDDEDDEEDGAKKKAKKPAKKKAKKPPLAPEKLIPDETTLVSRYCCLNYAMCMYDQVGATRALELPTTEEELRGYGFVRRDASKPLSRRNIKFAH